MPLPCLADVGDVLRSASPEKAGVRALAHGRGGWTLRSCVARSRSSSEARARRGRCAGPPRARMMAEASVAFVAIALLFSSAGLAGLFGSGARGCPRVGGTCCRCTAREPRGRPSSSHEENARIVGKGDAAPRRGTQKRGGGALLDGDHGGHRGVGTTSIVVEAEQLRPRCGAFLVYPSWCQSASTPRCDALLTGGRAAPLAGRGDGRGGRGGGLRAFLPGVPGRTPTWEVRISGNSDIRYDRQVQGPLRATPCSPLCSGALPGDTPRS